MAKRKSFRSFVRSRVAARSYAARKRAFYRARKKRSRRTRFARMYRNPLGLMNQKAVLHYIDDISLDPKPNNLGSTGSNVWQFSANSLYDPDTTGVGHQPMYFDNFMEVYQRYRVNFAIITVTVVNHFVNTSVDHGGVITTQPNYSYKLFIAADNTAITSEYAATMNTQLEEGGRTLKWRFIAPSLTGKLPKLKHTLSPHQLAGVPFKDDTLSGTVLASPSQPAYFYIGITSADGATDPPSVYLNVHIKYYCEFWDRKTIQAQN